MTDLILVIFSILFVVFKTIAGLPTAETELTSAYFQISNNDEFEDELKELSRLIDGNSNAPSSSDFNTGKFQNSDDDFELFGPDLVSSNRIFELWSDPKYPIVRSAILIFSIFAVTFTSLSAGTLMTIIAAIPMFSFALSFIIERLSKDQYENTKIIRFGLVSFSCDVFGVFMLLLLPFIVYFSR